MPSCNTFAMPSTRRALLALINVLALGLSIMAPAHAARGSVVDVRQECAYVVVQNGASFALLEIFAGARPVKGDTLSGDFESFGVKEVVNAASGRITRIRVEVYGRGEDEVTERFRDACGLTAAQPVPPAEPAPAPPAPPPAPEPKE